MDWLESLNFQTNPDLLGNVGQSKMFDPAALNRFKDWNSFASNPAINNLGNTGSVATAPGIFSRESAFGGGPNGGSGWAPTLLGFGQAAMSFANSRAQNRLAKQNFNRYRAESDLNIENQAKGINERLQTRETRRMKEQYGNLSEAERAGKVAEYMAKWGVKDKIQG
jgi:hypothetical protein